MSEEREDHCGCCKDSAYYELLPELRRQSQELETIKAVARESVEALARYCGQRKYRKIHLRQVFASVDALAALTQPAPEKP